MSMDDKEIADLVQNATQRMSRAFGDTLQLIPHGDTVAVAKYTIAIGASLFGQIAAIVASLAPTDGSEEQLKMASEAAMRTMRDHARKVIKEAMPRAVMAAAVARHITKNKP